MDLSDAKLKVIALYEFNDPGGVPTLFQMPFSPGWTFLVFLLFFTTVSSYSFLENVTIAEDMFRAYVKRAGAPQGGQATQPEELEEIHRVIVAIGDVHGNLDNLKKVLHMAGVTDTAGNWEKSERFTDPREKWRNPPQFFVQVGDLMDR